MEEKKWWRSTTIWINVAGIVAIVLELVIKSNLIPDPDVVTIILAIVNIINRFRVNNSKDVQPIEKSLL